MNKKKTAKILGFPVRTDTKCPYNVIVLENRPGYASLVIDLWRATTPKPLGSQ